MSFDEKDRTIDALEDAVRFRRERDQLRADLEEARRDLAEARTTAGLAIGMLDRTSAYRKHFPPALRMDLCRLLANNADTR